MKLIDGIWLLCAVVFVYSGESIQFDVRSITIQGYPWTTYIIGANDIRCGGSIISPNFVLSSALCSESTPITIVFGTNNFTRPLYTRTVLDEHLFINNQVNRPLAATLLLLRVDDITIGLAVQPIRLPRYSEVGRKQLVDYVAYLPGFGDTTYGESELLWLAHTKIIRDYNCVETFDPGVLTPNLICGAGYRQLNSGGCIGNVGTPLVILEEDGAPTQIGIFVQSDNECMSPSVFTSIEYDLDWIYDTTDVDFRY